MTRTRNAGRWKTQLPPERAYKRYAGAAAPAAEQDRAAGSRSRRHVALVGGSVARASITLRLRKSTRRICAYLRWSDGGKTEERYVCEVEHDSRRENLAEAWQHARAKGLLIEELLPPKSTASSPEVRASMRANRRKDTGPELALRRLLHQRGLRYRVDAYPRADIRRRADVVFPRDQVAIFVDGCFWHGCPHHYRPATKNAEFWRKKIEGNQARDSETGGQLRAAGWTVIRVWEHEDPAVAADHIDQLIRRQRYSRAGVFSSARRATNDHGRR